MPETLFYLDPNSSLSLQNQIRQLLRLQNAGIQHQPVDENGMVISSRLDTAQLIYVTPSHQAPTAATMAMQRRKALLKKAKRLDQLIIEDDFEHETNFLGQPHPAFAAKPTHGRPVSVAGSLRCIHVTHAPGDEPPLGGPA